MAQTSQHPNLRRGLLFPEEDEDAELQNIPPIMSEKRKKAIDICLRLLILSLIWILSFM
jgi:hypothetical protein